MALSDITLAGGMRSNLLNLQLTAALQARTSQRLSSGLKVNSPSDDPNAYFAAAAERSRASDLSTLKDSMGEALQAVSAADTGVKGIESLIDQAKGLIASARTASAADRTTLAGQYNALLTQIDDWPGDASYRGSNLLAAGSSLTVTFNETSTSSLTITGFDASSAGLAITAAANTWAAPAPTSTPTPRSSTPRSPPCAPTPRRSAPTRR